MEWCNKIHAARMPPFFMMTQKGRWLMWQCLFRFGPCWCKPKSSYATEPWHTWLFQKMCKPGPLLARPRGTTCLLWLCFGIQPHPHHSRAGNGQMGAQVRMSSSDLLHTASYVLICGMHMPAASSMLLASEITLRLNVYTGEHQITCALFCGYASKQISK